MAGVLISPKIDLQIRKRSDLYKKRNRSPSFKDVLRERCEARIKARRGALFDKLRFSSKEEVRNTFSGILREEVEDLTACSLPERMDLEPKPEVLSSRNAVTEEEEWLLEEYEKVLAEEEAALGLAWNDHIVCPVCQRSALISDNDHVMCRKCELCLSSTPDQLRTCLDQALSFHCEVLCSADPHFVLITGNLFLICELCGSCYLVA